MLGFHLHYALAASEDAGTGNDRTSTTPAAIEAAGPLTRKDVEALVLSSCKGTSCCAMAERPVVPTLIKAGVNVECCNGIKEEAPLVEASRNASVEKYLEDLELCTDKEISALHEPVAPTLDKQTSSSLKVADTALELKSGKVDALSDKRGACYRHATKAEGVVDSTTQREEMLFANGVSYYEMGFPHVLLQAEGVVDSATTGDDLLSANGVSYYELGFPNVLRPPADCNGKILDDLEASLYAYVIHCPVLHAGQDPIKSMPPTQFVLLNHFALDEEIVMNFHVRLNLPHQECVIAHLSASGEVHLTADQVKAAKLFNGLLFNFICGRSNSDAETAENKIKGYYVLPLKHEADLGTNANGMAVLIDWPVVLSFVNWKLDMREWILYQPGLLTTQVFMHNGVTTHENEQLRLKCGVYKEDDLVDAFVTYGRWNSRCFITGVAKDLCALSFMQGNQSGLRYKDYWRERFKVELRYVSQPLLIGYSLSRTGNFLQRPSQESLWCNAKAKRVILPPEVCILQPGLKGNLWRGAFKLPSILHGLESALLAAQLKNLIGVQISAFKLQEALTSGAYNVYQSYERLELIGDSYLTLVGAAALYISNISMSKEGLASSLHSLVRNKQLFQCAEASGLAPYVFNESFQIREWLPPGLRFEGLHPVVKNKAPSACLHGQRISWRTLADVVEAIVGACAMYGSTEDAVKAMSWLGIPIQLPEKPVCSLSFANRAGKKSAISKSQIANLERQLKYNFTNHDLVYLCYNLEDGDGGLQFCRLAFLGDCILSHHVARHFLRSHKTLDVGTINEMKQSVLNKESLACAAVRNRLHRFVTGNDLSYKEGIMAYASIVEAANLSRKDFPAFGLIGVSAPRALSDLVSAIAAAIFLDCGQDSELVWKVVRPLLEPIPEPGSFAVHPVNELTQFCRARFFSLDIQTNDQSSVYKVNVIVNNESIARAEHEEKRLARKYAAVQALCELGSREGGKKLPLG